MAYSDNSNETRIVEYLLGSLPEAETEQLEKDSFGDAELFEEIAHVEEQLIRNYLDGDLSGAEATAFESKYFAVQHLQKKVAFAVRLRAAIARKERVPAVPDPMVAVMPAKPVVRRWYWVIAGAAAVAFVVGNVSPSLMNRHVEPVNDDAKTRDPHPPSVTASPLADGILALICMPGDSKSSNENYSRTTVPPGTREVRLQLELPGAKEEVKVLVEVLEVKDNQKSRILTRTGLTASPMLTGATVTVGFSRAELPFGDYVLYVKRADNGNTLGYYFISLG